MRKTRMRGLRRCENDPRTIFALGQKAGVTGVADDDDHGMAHVACDGRKTPPMPPLDFFFVLHASP